MSGFKALRAKYPDLTIRRGLRVRECAFWAEGVVTAAKGDDVYVAFGDQPSIAIDVHNLDYPRPDSDGWMSGRDLKAVLP